MTTAFSNWLLASRPKTLVAAVVPVAVGTGLAKAIKGDIDLGVIICALGVALSIQIATNLFNDALDFKKGSDTEERIGPRRVTQSGLVSPKVMLIGGIACLAAALAFGIPLVLKGGVVIATLGAISMFLAYGYTGGPFPLAYLGLGDVFVMVFFGLIAVSATFFLHTGQFDIASIAVGFQVGATATLLLAVNNLRDVDQDRKALKNTLPVRFGIKFGRIEIAAMALLPPILGLYWFYRGWALVGALSFACLPFSALVIRGTAKNEPGPVYNRYLGLAALAHLVNGAMLTLGFWMERA